MNSSILIIGINPSSGKPSKTSATIQRLNRWMDSLGFIHYSFTNVIHHTGPYRAKDADIETLKNFAEGYSKVIALGPFVSKTLNTADINHFTLPHPSPLNRQLNDKEYEQTCLKNCRKYLEE